VSHVIVIGGDGTGPDGTAKGTIEWAPNHVLLGDEQIRRAEKAGKKLEKILDYLYGESEEPDHA